MAEMAKRKFKIYGKTEEDIESQFLLWLQKNPGTPFQRHPIESLPPLFARPHQKTEQHVAFSMLIEYEFDFTGRPRIVGNSNLR